MPDSFSARRLRGNKSEGIPRHCVFVACEPLQKPVPGLPCVSEEILRIGVAERWSRYRDRNGFRKSGDVIFTNANQFWDWLKFIQRKRDKLWVFSHNGYYDYSLLCLWSMIESGEFRILERGVGCWDHKRNEWNPAGDWTGKLAIDGGPFIVETRSDRGSVIFVDSRNYWPMPLEELCVKLDLCKLKTPRESSPDEDWIEYCRSGVTVIARAVTGVMARWKADKLGTWRTTSAGLAMGAYRHKFKHPDLTIHDCQEVQRLERQAYHSGRTTPRFVGDVRPPKELGKYGHEHLFKEKRPTLDGPIYYLDVNSMYGSVMQDSLYPCALIEMADNIDLAVAEKFIRHHGTIADVSLKARVHEYPLKQYRLSGSEEWIPWHEYDGSQSADAERTIYPRGEYRTVLAGPELTRAAHNREISQINRIACYQMAPLFRDYVKHFWEMRASARDYGDRITDVLASMCLKSLHGKFGQLTPRWKLDPSISPRTDWGPFVIGRGGDKKPLVGRAVAGIGYVKQEPEPTSHTFTAVSAYVSSYARILLDYYRTFCPDRSVIYEDTDSFFVTQAGFDALCNIKLAPSAELGKLKVKGVYASMRIFGQKNYDKDDTPVVAGLRRERRRVNQTRRWKERIRESVASLGSRPPDGSIRTWEAIYLSQDYATGVSVDADGWTRPLVIGGK